MPFVGELSILEVENNPEPSDFVVGQVNNFPADSPEAALIPISKLITDITINSTLIVGGTSGTLLFDNGGVVGGTTTASSRGHNLTWDGINLNSSFTVAFGAANQGPGLYVARNGDTPASLGWRFSCGLDANDISYCGFGGGGSQDALLYRTGQFTLATVVPDFWANASGAAWQVYNKWDTAAENFVSNYERGVFDWTSTTNVLTIGTQKAGTGVTRNIQIVIGGTAQLDFGITTANHWTAGGNFDAPFFNAIGASGSFTGFYNRLTTDTQNRVFFALNALDNPLFAFGAGGITVADIALIRPAARTIAIVHDPYAFAAGAPAFQIYNSLDAYVPANYERGIVDWTTNANTLTIGTQAAGSGTARDVLMTPATGTFRIAIGSSTAPVNNGELTFQATSNTSLTFKYKGGDGTIRSASLTLS